MTSVERARKNAGVGGSELAHAVGRTAAWLLSIESEQNRLAPETEKILLTAIGRLERFHRSVEEAKLKLCSDLRLPSRCASKPCLPGTVTDSA